MIPKTVSACWALTAICWLILATPAFGQGAIYRVDAATGDNFGPLPELVSDVTSAPSTSPDGTTIAYSVGAPGESHALWTANSDGSAAAPLGVEGSDPVWTPAGNIIFVSSDYEIDRVSAQGTDRVTLIEPGDSRYPYFQLAFDPSISRDGNAIAFTGAEWCLTFAPTTDECYQYPPQVYTADPDGTAVEGLAVDRSTSAGDTEPSLSPDGSTVTFRREVTDGGPYCPCVDQITLAM